MKTLVKVCGVRSLDAARAAFDFGADFIGLNFVPTSNRKIDEGVAKKIGKKLKGKIKLVGVFQNMPGEVVQRIIRDCGLDYAQFHGDETPEFIDQIDIKAIKAFRLPGDFDTQKARLEMQKYKVDYYLVDRLKQSEGPMLNLEKVRVLAQEFPLILAGGLNPDNVFSLGKKVKPYAVDVASGVETNGAQDLEKIKKFIKNATRLSLL